jgi:hypothetical protein
MRRWTCRILSVLALTLSVPVASFAAAPASLAAPHEATVATPQIQTVRWVNRCRTVRVWRHTRHHGRRLVPVRSCRRVWVR